jgi:hypothetical protein
MSRLRESPDGSFLSKVLAKQRDLPDGAVLDILAWCRCYADDPDSLWRLSQLGKNIARAAVGAEACDVAALVLARWLDPKSTPEPEVANNVAHVLAALMFIRALAVRERADQMFVQWLRHPHGFDASNWCRYGLPWRLISKAAELIEREVIDVVGDSSALDRFVLWAQRCGESCHARFATMPAWLSERLPQLHEQQGIQEPL